MAILLSLSPPNPVFPKIPSLLTPNPNSTFFSITTTSRRHSILKITSLFIISFARQQFSLAHSPEQAPAPALAKPSLSGIVNTKSWFQFVGDGFAIRVPPQFEDHKALFQDLLLL